MTNAPAREEAKTYIEGFKEHIHVECVEDAFVAGSTWEREHSVALVEALREGSMRLRALIRAGDGYLIATDADREAYQSMRAALAEYDRLASASPTPTK